jgi:hypothetical protein
MIPRSALLRWILGIALTAAVAVDRLPAASAAPGESALMPDSAYGIWAGVLSRYVDDEGSVGFAALAANRTELDRLVAWIGAVGPLQRPELFPTRMHVIAYHLNAYNALAMYNVVDEGIPEALGWLERIRFFFLKRFEIDGKKMSLYDYENDVIRPLGEERVHFALNCMSVGCPRLPKTPFRADTLESELEGQASQFFNESRNVRVDAASRTVHLSEILKFYGEDFLKKAPSLIAYTNRYRREPIPEGYAVRFIAYDWSVNRTGRKD